MSSNVQINIIPHHILGDCVVVYDVWSGDTKRFILTKNYFYDKIPLIIQFFEMKYLLVISNCFTYDADLMSLITLRADLFIIEDSRAVSVIVIYESQDVTDFYKKMFCIVRSEEHTSELQSRQYLVCRLLLEKKKKFLQPQP